MECEDNEAAKKLYNKRILRETLLDDEILILSEFIRINVDMRA